MDLRLVRPLNLAFQLKCILYVNCKNNICDDLRFSIEFSTEIILLCIRISINIIGGDWNSVAAIVTRCVFDGSEDRIPMQARCFVAYRPAPRPNRPLVK